MSVLQPKQYHKHTSTNFKMGLWKPTTDYKIFERMCDNLGFINIYWLSTFYRVLKWIGTGHSFHPTFTPSSPTLPNHQFLVSTFIFQYHLSFLCWKISLSTIWLNGCSTVKSWDLKLLLPCCCHATADVSQAVKFTQFDIYKTMSNRPIKQLNLIYNFVRYEIIH